MLISDIQLVVTPPPHIRVKSTISSVMYDVVLALTPALFAAIYFFGLNAIILVAICIVTCALTELLVHRLLGRPVMLSDGSALVTGMLLAFCLPPACPWWVAVTASVVAIAIGKEFFGGLGRNIFNPALFGRVFITSLLPFFPDYYIKPLWWKTSSFFNYLTPKLVELQAERAVYKLVDGTGRMMVDAVSTATPLKIIRAGMVKPTYLQMFIGHVKSGNLGETSILALLIGALYLLYKKHIDLKIPLSIIITTVIITSLYGQDPLFHLLSGGLILGAFFMATDWVTSPMTTKGKIVFGIGIGLFVSLVRLYGIRPEGMGLGILHMNVLAVFIDRLFLPKRFGEVKVAAA